MRLLQHIASMLLLIGLLCPAAQAAGQPDPLADENARRAAANWRDVLARIDSEEETLAACRATPDACSPAARQLLRIVELGRQRAGRARLGEINRAVNLSIKATSDWSQYGVDDFWSTPLATLEKGAGDYEDYAILKYLAYWLQSLVALILRFTARLISPSRARPARWRPSSTICSNRRAAGEHESGLARQAASVSPSESMRASTSIHFAAARRAISSAKGSG